MSRLVKHAGISELAGIYLGDVARGRLMQDGRGVRAHQIQLLQAGDVHQARLGPNRQVVERDVLRVRPGAPHAVPVLELRAQRAMAISENRGTPTQCHGVTPEPARGKASASCVMDRSGEKCAATMSPVTIGNKPIVTLE